MTLVVSLKTALKEEMKIGNEVHKNILRVALSEIDVNNARAAEKGKDLSEEQQEVIIRKILENNDKTALAFNDRGDVQKATTLKEENEYLKTFLPKLATSEEVSLVLNMTRKQILEAKKDGLAIGLAMAAMKKSGLRFENNMVSQLVKEMRSGKFVFVYGTLKQNYPNSHHMEGCEFIGTFHTKPKYTMYSCHGMYPGLKQCGDTSIEGEVYHISSEMLESKMRQLDRLEGYPDLYSRADIELLDFEQPVFSYFYNYDTSKLKVCGNRWEA